MKRLKLVIFRSNANVWDNDQCMATLLSIIFSQNCTVAPQSAQLSKSRYLVQFGLSLALALDPCDGMDGGAPPNTNQAKDGIQYSTK